MRSGLISFFITGWIPLGEVMRSGVGDTQMTAKVYLVTKGYVSFTYKVISKDIDVSMRRHQDDMPDLEQIFDLEQMSALERRSKDEDDVYFQFLVDGEAYIRKLTTSFHYVTTVIQLPPGVHKLSWNFVGGVTATSSLRGHYVDIDKILIGGTEYASRQQLTCREGYYQDQPGQAYCKMCPEGEGVGEGERREKGERGEKEKEKEIERKEKRERRRGRICGGCLYLTFHISHLTSHIYLHTPKAPAVPQGSRHACPVPSTHTASPLRTTARSCMSAGGRTSR